MTFASSFVQRLKMRVVVATLLVLDKLFILIINLLVMFLLIMIKLC